MFRVPKGTTPETFDWYRIDAPGSSEVVSGLLNKPELASTANGEGSELVGFRHSGAGSVVRTDDAKLQEFVSPHDFGAVGDGVTDDTAAFEAANSSGRSVMCDGTKTYLLNAFKIAASTVVDFSGAIVRRVDRASCAVDASSTNGRFVNANFDGNVFDGDGLADGSKVASSTVVSWPASNQIEVANGTNFAVGQTAFFGATPRLATTTLSGTPSSLAGRIASVSGNTLTLEQDMGGSVLVGAKIIADFPLVHLGQNSFRNSVTNCSFRRFIVGLETAATSANVVGNALPLLTNLQFYNFTGAAIVQTAGFAGETLLGCHLNGFKSVSRTHTATAGQTRFAYDWNVSSKCHRGGGENTITATVNGTSAAATVDETTQEIVLSSAAADGDTVVVKNSEWSPRLILAQGVSGGPSSIGRVSTNLLITAEVGIEIYGDASSGGTAELAFINGTQVDGCSFAGIWIRDTDNIYLNGSSFLFCRYPVIVAENSANVFMSPLHTDIMPDSAVNTIADSPNTASVTVDPSCSAVCIPTDTAFEKGGSFSLIDSGGVVDEREGLQLQSSNTDTSAGVALKVGAFGLGVNWPAFSGDLDNITRFSCYTATGSTSNIPTAGSSDWGVLTIPMNISERRQIAFKDDSETWEREYSGGGWFPWRLVHGGRARNFAQIPSASAAGQGARHFVADANTNTFGAVVSGGGSNKVPIYSDGTDWRVG